MPSAHRLVEAAKLATKHATEDEAWRFHSRVEFRATRNFRTRGGHVGEARAIDASVAGSAGLE